MRIFKSNYLYKLTLSYAYKGCFQRYQKSKIGYSSYLKKHNLEVLLDKV